MLLIVGPAVELLLAAAAFQLNICSGRRQLLKLRLYLGSEVQAAPLEIIVQAPPMNLAYLSKTACQPLTQQRCQRQTCVPVYGCCMMPADDSWFRGSAVPEDSTELSKDGSVSG